MAKRAKQVASNALDVDRSAAALVAACKLEILAEALITLSDHAEAGKFEDVAAAISIVSSVARRQLNLAKIIVRALDGVSTDSSPHLGLEAHNG